MIAFKDYSVLEFGKLIWECWTVMVFFVTFFVFSGSFLYQIFINHSPILQELFELELFLALILWLYSVPSGFITLLYWFDKRKEK
jgi:hypothetical protein